jgi:hypothetical protein
MAAAEINSDFCMAHEVHGFIVDRSRIAMQKGDIISGILGMFASQALSEPAQVVQHVRHVYHTVRPSAVGAPTAQPKKPSCWEILRLDRQKATEADVKKVQRALAAIYHNDKRTDGTTIDAMAEINAAAAECLKELRKK